jgi:hypothetical protein
MDTRAFRIAEQFVRQQLKKAQYAPEFLRWVENRRFPNPNPQGRLDTVKFNTLPDDEQARIFEQWRRTQQVGTGQATPDFSRVVEIARKGRKISEEVLSEGGKPGSPINQSFIVQLDLDGQTQNFINKPATGETPYLRYNIPAGEYHAREQAVYYLDQQIGGRPVVPVTQTRGPEEGSYQLWVNGTRQLSGEDFDSLVQKIPIQDLSQNPDFQRLNLLDLLTGHQDRHRGNLLFFFEGSRDEPESLRFVAIDNGLSLAGRSSSIEDYRYVNPFTWWYTAPDTAETEDPQLKFKLRKEGIKKGNAVVAESLSNIHPALHEQIKKIDLTELAREIKGSGVSDASAVQAVLVRVAAMQANPNIFEQLLEEFGSTEEAWKAFQHLSSQGPDLLERSGNSQDWERIRNIVEGLGLRGSAEPKPGLHSKALEQLAAWGEDQKPTVKRPRRPWDPPERDHVQLASLIAKRWLSAKDVKSSGRRLTVSLIDSKTREPKVLGVFDLGDKGKVGESYSDWRFQAEIQEGVWFLGKLFWSEDGPSFMGALEKAYGHRSMYDVRRS